jgi:hypothetical protein
MGISNKLREAKQRLALAQGGDVSGMQDQVDKTTADLLQKYELNMEHTSDSAVKRANASDINKIQNELFGNGLLKVGLLLKGSASERAQLGYLTALVKQNWILMRQNELMIRHLEKIAEKDS